MPLDDKTPYDTNAIDNRKRVKNPLNGQMVPVSPEYATEERGTLNAGEPHPSAEYALKYIKENCGNLFTLQEAMASCAIEGNRIAEICGETLDRLITGKPISDRYVMGLAWFIYEMKQLEKEK